MSYQHGEAYCLMKYCDKDGNEEYVWNARDGVTPFTIPLREGGFADHVEWKNDVRLPDYDPPIGSRVFLDLTLEMALHFRRLQVEAYWDHPEVPLKAQFHSKEEAAASLANADMAQPGSPILMIVDQELKEYLAVRRKR